MRYYWQTKYTTLIYIPFFIFPHNRHFFVHISPSVLEVWKCPCGKTPFQPSEDTDALLSELPPLSHNVVHAADPSQIRKDGSRRVPDQGYRRGVEELPTPSLQLLLMRGKRRGGEHCHAGWWCFVPDVNRAMHNGACAVSGHNDQQCWCSCRGQICWITILLNWYLLGFVFYLIYLLCLSLLVFTLMLILRLLLCLFVFESLVAHASLFGN